MPESRYYPKTVLKAVRQEKHFRRSLIWAAAGIVVLVIAFFLTLTLHSIPSIRVFGIHFLAGRIWDPVNGVFGAFPFLLGTLLTSFLALLISIPFSIAIALFLGEYFPRGFLSGLLKNAVDLIAAIPSVIYGFWGLFVLVPLVRILEMKLGVAPYGIGIFAASLILSVMIIPYAASLGAEIVRMTPVALKEGAYSLGATRAEVIRQVIIPFSRSGLLAGILLSLGRALGETMAVTMVIGNSSLVPSGIFAPGNTMASVIANEFTEAADPLHLSALIELGLVLFLVTTLIHLAGKRIIKNIA